MIRTVCATIALTAGLAFAQAPAHAIDNWHNVRPVSKPVRVTTLDPMVNLIRPVSKPVKACFKGKMLVPCPKVVPAKGGKG
jgi:hypothetical protein